MGDLLNLLLPFVTTPKNYADVLRKLAACVFYETYLITFFLRDIPLIGSAFRAAETYGSLGRFFEAIPFSSTLNIAGLAVAFGVAMLTFVTQLHDRVSDLLRVRTNFDRDQILVPLAHLVHVQLTPNQITEMMRNRDRIMRQVFYRYASDRAENAIVDRHDIEHALGRWAWLWVLLEAVVIFFFGALIAFAFNSTTLANALLTVSIVAALLALLQRRRLGRHARAQIEAIAADPAAADEVRSAFNAL